MPPPPHDAAAGGGADAPGPQITTVIATGIATD